MVDQFRKQLAAMPDRRTGSNTQYSMEDIGLSAFAVFFTQSPSFLAHQKAMQQAKGANNAQALFQIGDIPTDNHVRDTLDPVPPEHIFPVYDSVYQAFAKQGILNTFQAVHNTRLIALDGTWYFSSEKIHCQNCSHIEHKSGPVAAGRARWKIENENNNTLKTKGYHLEHNFGHGKQHLSSLLATMNILAFLFHSFLTFCDEAYRLIRAKLPTRKTFFEHIRALTYYMYFPSWDALMDFMMRGLEIGHYAKETPQA
ncbi:MAG: hypothetical protein HY360_10830 [Verrucomicrobia bacterium]|nr:hypothetical protein [Verrucomicrobiota bacterium]